MTHETDSALDRFQRYTTDDVQRTRRQRSADAQSREDYVIDVVFLLLDRRDLDSEKDGGSEKHHAPEDEKLFSG
jgi:hypothetical protein